MTNIKPLKWIDFLWLFGIPTLLNYIGCQVAIPYMEKITDLPIEIIYFLCVGGLVLFPMFIWAIYLTGNEIGSYKLKSILERMRIKKMTKQDWIWTVMAFVLLSLASFLIAKLIMPSMGMDATPFFFKNMPLSSEHMWIMYVWPIYFFFNIFGEEFLWRGYIQPRQELLNKKWTRLFHGIFWSFWHLPMGFDLVFVAIPLLFILPAIVQIRQNTTIAIIVHIVFGGFGFIVLALGGVH